MTFNSPSGLSPNGTSPNMGGMNWRGVSSKQANIQWSTLGSLLFILLLLCRARHNSHWCLKVNVDFRPPVLKFTASSKSGSSSDLAHYNLEVATDSI